MVNGTEFIFLTWNAVPDNFYKNLKNKCNYTYASKLKIIQ